MISVDLNCPVEGCPNVVRVELEVEHRDGNLSIDPVGYGADYCDEHASVRDRL